MVCKVKCRKSQLDYFRKIARESPDKEVLAYLIGEVYSPFLTIITSFEYTKDYHTQTYNCVCWYRDEYKKVCKKAEKLGKKVVGSIHSHPEWDAVMSGEDYNSHFVDGMRISGICSTMGKKTRVRFWVPESSLPCELIYVK